MSLEIIRNALQNAKNEDFNWNLFFFIISGKNTRSYESYKIQFVNPDTLINYKNTLIDIIDSIILPNYDEVLEYDGYNSKRICDKVSLDNELIKDEYGYFINSIFNANYDILKSKYHGYILLGQKENRNIIFIKKGNPVTTLKSDKKVYLKPINNKLDSFSDDVLKLCYSADSIIIDTHIYNFNHAFEDIFNLEKTLKRIKNNWLPIIVTDDNFYDKERVFMLMESVPSVMFANIDSKRLERFVDANKRGDISSILNIELKHNKYSIDSVDEAKYIIKYLSNKIVQEKESDEVYESSSTLKKISS